VIERHFNLGEALWDALGRSPHIHTLNRVHLQHLLTKERVGSDNLLESISVNDQGVLGTISQNLTHLLGVYADFPLVGGLEDLEAATVD